MRNLVVLVLCMLLQISAHANICINEVMQSNVNGIMDELNEYPDSWVEIYNDDTTSFDFTGYSISRSRDFTESYPLMDSTVIAPKGYLLIYCDKEEEIGGRHADFRLDVDQDTLYVFDPVGHVVDSLVVPEMLAPDIAYGRITDGNDTLSHFKQATPNAPNGGFHTSKILKKPQFSVKGGIYQHPIVLRLSLQGSYPSDAVVRYTTNGSEPTEDSPIAPDSILIETTTVIRAKTFSDSALSKISKTETYIIPEREYTLPIISIVTDSANMYDDEIGILVEGTYGETHPDVIPEVWQFGHMNYFYSWKRPINLEYFDTRVSNQAVINQLCETEIGGNTSAYFTTKSLNVRANKRFGENKFSYPFWADKPDVTKSKCIYLRNSGQDFNCLHFRDAMNHMSFGQNVDVDWQASQPVVVLINGKYYGLVNLREKVNPDYIWSNYNKLENIDLLVENNRDVKAGDLEEYGRYRALLEDSLASYSQIDSLIDLNEFMNYFILSVLYCNKDFPANNQMIWRERSDSAKWRFILKDTDVTANLTFNSVWNYPYFNYILHKEPYNEEGTNYIYGCRVFMKTMSYPEISNQVIDRLSVYMGTFVSVESCANRLDSLAALIEAEIPYYYEVIDRNPKDWEFWKNHHKEFMRQRVPFLYNYTHEFFELGDTTSLKITSTKKKLYFNSVPVKNGRFEGCYYYGRPIYLSGNATAFRYVGDSVAIVAEDSVSRKEDGCWYVSYVLNDSNVVKRIDGKSLYFVIPEGAKNVQITDEYKLVVEDCESLAAIDVKLKTYDCGLPTKNYPLQESIGHDSFLNTVNPMMKVSSDTFFVGDNTIEWLYVDVYGDTTVCRQKFTVEDLSAPLVENCEKMDTLRLFLEENESALHVDNLYRVSPVGWDNCASPIFGTLEDNEGLFYAGTTDVHWTFADAAGNTTTCLQTIAVVDTIAPTFDGCDSLPEIKRAIYTNVCGFAATEFEMEPLKAKDGGIWIEGLFVTGDSLYIGRNEGYWKFEDASGNALHCKQTVMLIDSFAPYVDACDSMPELQLDLVDDVCGLVAADLVVKVPMAIDNCGVAIAGKLLAPDTLSVGETLVAWIFADEAGNETKCKQTVVVNDRYAPVYDKCDSLPSLKYEVYDNACGIAKEELQLPIPVAVDNCSVKIEGRLSAPDFLPFGETVMQWVFADAYGNMLECPQTVQVLDKVPPYYEKCQHMPKMAFSVTDNSMGFLTSSMLIPTPVAVDNCNEFVRGECDLPEVMQIGEHLLEWKFADAAGNTVVCEQQVAVLDRFAPVYDDCESMPDVEFDLKDASCAVALERVPLEIPVALDNGDVEIAGQLKDAPSVCTIGETELTWQFKDASGNNTLCKQVVVVYDRFAPFIDCSSIDTFVVDLPLNANEVDATLVELPLLSAIDNCNVRVPGQMECGAFYQIGSNEVEWTFTDAFGNISSCPQVVKGVKHFQIQTYPNPVDEYLCVAGAEEGDVIVIENSLGLHVSQQKVTGNPTYVSFGGYVPGLYFVYVNDNLYKIIKK